MRGATDGTPAGLYIHIPFCSAICPYCDFAVVTGNAGAREKYVDALVTEIELYEDVPFQFDTVYFGGGTPSAMTSEQLQRVLAAALTRYRVAEGVPVLLEANPEDVTEESAAAWRSLGIRTLSLGVQSFDDAQLRFLGRRHSAEDSRRSVEVALAAGFKTVSLDLIFGTPGQLVPPWREELLTAVGTGCHHVSCYQLTVHEGTVFARWRDKGRLQELPNELQADLYDCAHAVLSSAGFQAYEVSNFARGAEHRSRHNSKYWTHAPYVGVGLGAHSFSLTERWWNERELAAYMRKLEQGKLPVAGREQISARELALETVMLRLRTVEGLDLHEFRERFGEDLRERNKELFERLRESALVIPEDDDHLRLTPRGMAVTDAIAREIRLGEPG